MSDNVECDRLYDNEDLVLAQEQADTREAETAPVMGGASAVVPALSIPQFFRAHEDGLEILGDPGPEICGVYAQGLRTVQQSLWMVAGDLLVYVKTHHEDHYGAIFERLCSVWERQTLQNWQWICSKIPRGKRRPILGVSIHSLVAALAPPIRDRVLDEAWDQELTVDETRRVVESVKRQLPEGDYDAHTMAPERVGEIVSETLETIDDPAQRVLLMLLEHCERAITRLGDCAAPQADRDAVRLCASIVRDRLAAHGQLDNGAKPDDEVMLRDALAARLAAMKAEACES